MSFHHLVSETQSTYVLKPRVVSHYPRVVSHYICCIVSPPWPHRVQVTHISTAKHACTPFESLVAFQILSSNKYVRM